MSDIINHPPHYTEHQSHDHYFKDVQTLKSVDVYRVLVLFGVTNPCIQHAVKKLLCAGQRGAKGQKQDVQEAIASLLRYLEMQTEDENK
jgi:hypothetical protein